MGYSYRIALFGLSSAPSAESGTKESLIPSIHFPAHQKNLKAYQSAVSLIFLGEQAISPKKKRFKNPLSPENG